MLVLVCIYKFNKMVIYRKLILLILFFQFSLLLTKTEADKSVNHTVSLNDDQLESFETRKIVKNEDNTNIPIQHRVINVPLVCGPGRHKDKRGNCRNNI